MKIKNLFILFVFFFIGFSFAPSEDLTEYTITVLDESGQALQNVSVHIDRFQTLTNEFGKTSVMLFPGAHNISISKEDYVPISKNISFSDEQELGFTLQKSFTLKKLFIENENNELITRASLIIRNLDTNNTKKLVPNSNPTSIKLTKAHKYSLEAIADKYLTSTKKIISTENSDSQIRLQLEKKSALLNFNFNVASGSILFFSDDDKLIHDDIFSDNSYNIRLPYGNYYVHVKSADYFKYTKKIEVSKFSENYNLNLNKRTKDFTFVFEINSIQDFVLLKEYQANNFHEKDIASTHYTIKQNDTVVSTGSALTSASIKLEEGTYEFYAENKNAYPFSKKEIHISKNTENIFLVKMKKLPVFVSGRILLPTTESPLTIIFEEKSKRRYETTSKPDGKFNVVLPTGLYKIIIDNDHYVLNEKEKAYDFVVPGKTYNLSLDTQNLDSSISGYVETTRNKVISGAAISIKIGNSEKQVFSNQDGYYYASIKNGLAVVKASKSGYRSKGNVKKIAENSYINNFNFHLEEIFSSINGTVTDGVLPISGLKIGIQDKKSDFENFTSSDSNGNFSFQNISISGKYVIFINNKKYVDYQSQEFKVSEGNAKTFNIILEKKSLNVILDIKAKNGQPLTKKEVFLNNVQYKTDINGLVEVELNTLDEMYTLDVNIPEYNFSKSLQFSRNAKSPLVYEIVLK